MIGNSFNVSPVSFKAIGFNEIEGTKLRQRQTESILNIACDLVDEVKITKDLVDEAETTKYHNNKNYILTQLKPLIGKEAEPKGFIKILPYKSDGIRVFGSHKTSYNPKKMDFDYEYTIRPDGRSGDKELVYVRKKLDLRA